ncbi:MAG TPA: pre-peptidase C-terminal domain-containing protein [Longimicrobium sp.]|nr:pre-peptidase C-terminal domain-containing protein [Longimicrobium sp.]
MKRNLPFSLVLAALLATAAACDDDSTGPSVAAATPSTAETQRARAGDTVAVRPAVRLTDGEGQPLAGVPVTFAVTGGLGSVETAEAVTGADGVASAGAWRLGTGIGHNQVIATAPGLAPVYFRAIAVDPCILKTEHTFGTTSQGETDALDCVHGGQRVDYFAFPADAAHAFAPGQALALTLGGPGELALQLLDLSGRPVAIGEEAAPGRRVHVIGLAQGRYNILAGASAPGVSYTLASAAAAADVGGCARPWIVRGATVTQQLTAADDCYPGRRADRFQVWLAEGATLTVRQDSPDFDTFLRLFDAAGEMVASDDDSGEGSGSVLTFTAETAGTYTIEATSVGGLATGGYTLAVE